MNETVILTPAPRYVIQVGKVTLTPPASGEDGVVESAEWAFHAAYDDLEVVTAEALATASTHEYVRVVDKGESA